jgi:hypothetical protein
MSEPQAVLEEISAVIGELEQYRQRIIDDTLAMAQKAKVMKATTLEHLKNHPEIAQIDAMLQDLRSRQEVLENDN